MESISYWMLGGYQLLVFQGSPLCKHSGTKLVLWEMHTLAYNHFLNKRQKVLSKVPFYHYPSCHNCCSGKQWKMKRLHAGDHCTFTSPLLYFGDWLKYTTDGRHMYTLCFYVLDIKCFFFFHNSMGLGRSSHHDLGWRSLYLQWSGRIYPPAADPSKW